MQPSCCTFWVELCAFIIIIRHGTDICKYVIAVTSGSYNVQKVGS